MSLADREALHEGREGLIPAGSPSAQATLNGASFAMGGGTVRNDLSTALVKLYRELFGRGPVRTMTYAFDAGYVTFLHGVLSPHEHVLIRRGRLDLVCEAREVIREAERERLVARVQRLTGCPVLHDAFQLQPELDLAIELFWIPTGSEHGAGNAPARRAVAPTGSRHRGVLSEAER